MVDHLSAQLIEAYRQRALEPAEMLAADVHLAACAACRQAWRSALALPSPAHLQATVLAAQMSELEEHLAVEQVRAYIAGQLDAVDHELAESHLEVCAACQTQTAAARVTPQAAKKPWWHSILPAWLGNLGEASVTWQLGEASLTWPLAGAALLLVSLAWGLTSWRQSVRRVAFERASPTPTATGQPRLSVPSPAPASQVLALNDGERQITLDAQGALTGFELLPEVERQQITAALTRGRIETPAILVELRSKANTLMGAPPTDPALIWATNSAATLRTPVGVVLETPRPTLRWKALPSATSYVVTINEPAANFREAAVSPKLTKPLWTVPTALPRGRLYTWQVTATLNGREVTAPAPSTPEAKFRVLTAAQAEELAQGRQTYAGQHLPLGLLYARLGLLAEAEHEFQALAQANPSVPVVQKLLGEIRAKQAGLRR